MHWVLETENCIVQKEGFKMARVRVCSTKDFVFGGGDTRHL